MTDVEQQLRGALRERATPPAAPPERYETVRRRGQARRRMRRLAAVGAAAGALVAVAVVVPMALPGGSDAAGVPSHPPASRLSEVRQVFVRGQQLTAQFITGDCDGPGKGVAWLAGGSWHLAVWTPGSHGADCISIARNAETQLSLPRPYGGEPMIDEATGRKVAIRGDPDSWLPTYLPSGYTLGLADRPDAVNLAGQGEDFILLLMGGPDVGADLDKPGWRYDVLDRPKIAGHQGTLIRYRPAPDWVELRWTDGTRTFRIQSISRTLDPRELVKLARSIPTDK
ncbi:MAG TPA: hypothetical protein VMU51_12910 [Mycobacteriales bacterium]|nr:hypothetical protein [Mycobacteriales bacterium]